MTLIYMMTQAIEVFHEKNGIIINDINYAYKDNWIYQR